MRLKVIEQGKLRYCGAAKIGENYTCALITMPRDEYCFKSSYSRLDDIPGITGRNSKLRYSLIFIERFILCKGTGTDEYRYSFTKLVLCA